MTLANLGVSQVAIDATPVRALAGDELSSASVAGRRTVSRTPRLLVLVAALLLAATYFLPLWSVRLTAPQYPEGLGMHIRINTVEGATETDLNNINNLNHYIGMKRIEPESIPELRFMPWIIAAMIVTGIATAALARRKMLYMWAVLFVIVAAAGLVDFWKWEYDYGHHLDNEHAVLKIPGMTYQPPLIGSKQLLNFRATSWPAAGGVLACIALAVAVAAAVIAWREHKTAMQASERAIGSNQ